MCSLTNCEKSNDKFPKYDPRQGLFFYAKPGCPEPHGRTVIFGELLLSTPRSSTQSPQKQTSLFPAPALVRRLSREHQLPDQHHPLKTPKLQQAEITTLFSTLRRHLGSPITPGSLSCDQQRPLEQRRTNSSRSPRLDCSVPVPTRVERRVAACLL